MQIRGLTLDELELASLRGDLQDLSLDLNFLTREGRGEVQMTTPRHASKNRGIRILADVDLCAQVQWIAGRGIEWRLSLGT